MSLQAFNEKYTTRFQRGCLPDSIVVQTLGPVQPWMRDYIARLQSDLNAVNAIIRERTPNLASISFSEENYPDREGPGRNRVFDGRALTYVLSPKSANENFSNWEAIAGQSGILLGRNIGPAGNSVLAIQTDLSYIQSGGLVTDFITFAENRCPEPILGCTNRRAENYNPDANTDDGSCIIKGCTNPRARNYDRQATLDSGLCEILGCTDPEADNYDPTANIDNGTCRRTIDPVAGCTDPRAENYNSAATFDDGTCQIKGCTDPQANNFDPSATIADNTKCRYAIDKVAGCTDPKAKNFNSSANFDDGTCQYNTGVEGCMDKKATNYNASATISKPELCVYAPPPPDVVTVDVTFTTVVQPSGANDGRLTASTILLNGKRIGVGSAAIKLERGKSYTAEYTEPSHPDYYFGAGVPPKVTFTIPANPVVGEKYTYRTVFTGIRLPSSYLTVTATYSPPITDKNLVGRIRLNGIEPIELNKLVETFDPTTQAVLISTGAGNVQLRVPPGVYNISFTDVSVPGMTYATPAPFSVTVGDSQVVKESRVYLGTVIPPTYWLKPISSAETAQQNFLYTRGMFSDDIANLTTFYTGSNTVELDNHYTHVLHRPETNPTSEIQFSIAYGHVEGSGSNGPDAQYNDSPTRAIYGQYRNLILGSRDGKFNLTGTETDHFYVISYQKDRSNFKTDFDALEINIAHLSGSEFINGEGYELAHTGSNVKLGGEGKVLRLVTDSKVNTDVELGTAGIVYNIVSGSIENGVYNINHKYGKLYPSLGVVLLDANKLDMSASFGTVVSRELDVQNQLKLFTAISGAALFTDGNSEDLLGMKARAIVEETVNYYFLNVRTKEFNFTNNPSYRSLTSGEILGTYETRPKTYMTSLGLYDEERNLVAVVKLNKPIKKTFTDEVTFNVRLKL